MHRFLRFSAIAISAFVLTGFTHTEPQYTVEFPEGWVVTPVDAQGLVVAKPAEASPDGINCNAQFVDRPQLAPYTQDQINAQFGAPLTLEGWGEYLGMEPSAIQISEAEAIDIGGIFMQIATIALQAEATPITIRMGFIAMPGKILNAGCFSKTTGFDAHKALFDTTVRSLKPV